jgi:hypothetical protein
MFPVKSHLSLANSVILVLSTKQNFNKVKTSLVSNKVFKLVFESGAELILCAVDPIYHERSEDPSDNIKPVTVKITKLTLTSCFIEISITYNSRQHTFICNSFQYTV